jgi:hypothetical protein
LVTLNSEIPSPFPYHQLRTAGHKKFSFRSVSQGGFPTILRPYCHHDCSPILEAMCTFSCPEMNYANHVRYRPSLVARNARSEGVQIHESEDCAKPLSGSKRVSPPNKSSHPHAHFQVEGRDPPTPAIQLHAHACQGRKYNFSLENREFTPGGKSDYLPHNRLEICDSIRFRVLVNTLHDKNRSRRPPPGAYI